MNRTRFSIAVALFAVGGGIWWLISHHHKYSWPFCMRKQLANSEYGPRVNYVVCLECGKEFLYDTETLKVGNEIHINNYPANIKVEERRAV